ncbi:alcohol dehydrogenase 2-like [Arachis stenosperma]|uniref:alcohol dehydrogenase 2-like n=1 Tax=Arachis stenosperma TaxID=217475 RepID=UPI0025AC3680|nr:alcohol dehydrogenase 2-like [Arachis stenosperma]
MHSLQKQRSLLFQYLRSSSNSNNIIHNSKMILSSSSSLLLASNFSSTAGKVIPCKAAVAWEAGKPLVIEDVEVAPPQAKEVRINIKYSSLCHTDLYFWESKSVPPIFPRILGHEASGVVESVGDGVSNLKPGDHVLPLFTGECGECPNCKCEDSNMCEVLRINPTREGMISDEKSRFSTIKDKEPISHFLGTSTFSQYTVVHSGSVVKINPTLPLDKACLLSCGISTGIGSILNVAKPKKGASIAIFGLGTVGLAAAEGAKIAGASRIIGIDKNPNKLEYAMKFGLTDFINPEEHERPVHEVLKEMTNGGVDRCIECTGNINALMSAMEALHDGWGVAVLVGVPSGDAVFKTNPFNFLNEKTITGTTFGNYKPKTGLPTLVDMFLNNKLELDKFITHRVRLSEINKAFDYMIKGQGLRTIIDMND